MKKILHVAHTIGGTTASSDYMKLLKQGNEAFIVTEDNERGINILSKEKSLTLTQIEQPFTPPLTRKERRKKKRKGTL